VALTISHGRRDWLGECKNVLEQIYAIRNRRGEQHPLVQQILACAVGQHRRRG